VHPSGGLGCVNVTAVLIAAARIVNCRISRYPIALIPPFLKVGPGQRRQDPLPGCFEVSARMIEVYRCTAPILTRLYARVKAGVPPELLVVDRAAGAARNRADLHIAVIDVPAVLALRIAAAGKVRPDP
jgi:hypothetical protein